MALTDAELVSRCRAGDHEAWRELVERYSRYVYAITQAFRLSQHDAEDVFQDTFARAYERLHTLRDDEALRPWLASLTRRLCIDRLRAGGREQLLEDLELEAGVDDPIEQLTEALDVHEALADLPERCREILDRFFARDESYRTIAEALDLPAGTIASRISRCLARLKDHLREETPAAVRLENDGSSS
jgi:RNA polymerase sigma factor (sigma-70 family)